MENALRQLVCLVMGTLIIYLVIQNYFKTKMFEGRRSCESGWASGT